MEQRIETLALAHASRWWRRIVAIGGLACACATFALPDSSSGSPQTAHNEHPQSGRAGAVVLDSAITILESADAPEPLQRAAQDLATDLEKVLGKKPRVVTREQLLRDVWDTTWTGSTRTVDQHVSWLRSKIGEDKIVTVRGRGFRFRTSDET